MINPVPRGSKVGIVSPSSALDSPEDIRDGLRWLESCGYRVVLGTHVYDRLNHMAGTPEQQAEDLMRFLPIRKSKRFCRCRRFRRTVSAAAARL